MTDRLDDFLDADAAARLWARAAELQAESARVAESLPAVSTDPAGSDGYSLDVVRSAAIEAGIADEYVDAALADMRIERSLPQPRLGPKGRRLMRLFFRDVVDAITVRRLIRAGPEDVLSALEVTVHEDPYRLNLIDHRGDRPEGTVLVFDVRYDARPLGGLAREVVWSGLRQVFVSVAAIAGPENACEITLRGPLTPTHHVGLAQGVAAMGLGAASLGGGAAAALAGLLSGPAGLAATVAVVGAWGLTGGAIGRRIYRGICARGVGRAERAFEGLLGAVAARAEGRWMQPSPSQ